MADDAYCSARQLAGDAVSTASSWLMDCAEEIDRQFGAGYARDHPELLGRMLHACALDSSANLVAQRIVRAGEDISRAIAERGIGRGE